MSFINCIKVAGAEVNPNSNMVNSYKPYQVWNAVLCVSSGLILIWWYPDQRLILKISLYQIINQKAHQFKDGDIDL